MDAGRIHTGSGGGSLMEGDVMKTSNRCLVLSRNSSNFVVISHNNETLYLQVAERCSLVFEGPTSFVIRRNEVVGVEGISMPETGNLVLTRSKDSSIVINHDGETLKVTVRKVNRTQVVLNGPRSFDVLRDELDDRWAA